MSTPGRTARRLEAALAEAGIAYGHLPELAPEYVSRYTEEVLDQVDLEPIVKWIGAQHPALLCVERDPEACHRSLIAARLQSEFDF